MAFAFPLQDCLIDPLLPVDQSLLPGLFNKNPIIMLGNWQVSSTAEVTQETWFVVSEIVTLES